MDDSSGADGYTADQLSTLALPGLREPGADPALLAVDELLRREKIPVSELGAVLERHHAGSSAGLQTLGGKLTFDDVHWLGWPDWLYIPGSADSHNYWVSTAPGNRRYGLAWTAPQSATANRASAATGALFTFSQLPAETPEADPSSESGVGIFYSPTMSLGVVDFQPEVDVSGMLTTALNFFPTLAAGSVEVRAQLLLCAWQVIPGGFDLLRFTTREVASSGHRDQSHGDQRHSFSASFAGAALSAPFLVQRGRTYLFGVVCRVVVSSTLTNDTGGALRGIPNRELVVYGAVNCLVPQMSVHTSQVYIA